MTRLLKTAWIVGLAAVFYLLAAPRFDVGTFNDDARDILAARSILQGSYRDLQSPSRPPLNFPLPGFPLLLAPFVFLVKSHLAWLKLLPIGFMLGSVWLVSRMWREYLSPPLCLLLTFLFAINPTTVMLSGRVIADAAYLFFVFSAFYQVRQTPSGFRDTLLWLSAGAALFIRPEGAFLVISILAALLYGRQLRSMRGGVLVSLAFGLLLFWNWSRTGTSSGYWPLMNQTLPILSRGIGSLAAHSGELLQTLILNLLLAFPGQPTGLAHLSIVAALIGFVLLWVGFGLRQWLGAPSTPPAFGVAIGLYTFFHLWMHGVWLAVDVHYLWPVLPVVLFFMLYAVDHRLSPRVKTWAGIPVLVAVILLYGWQDLYAWRQAWTPSERQTVARSSFDWVRQHTSPDAFVLAPQAAALTLYAGRHSIAFLSASDPDEFRSRLLESGFSHVVASPPLFMFVQTEDRRNPSLVWKREQSWLAQDSKAYEPVYRNEAESFTLYRVKPDPKFQTAYADFQKAITVMHRQPKMDWSSILDQLERVIRQDPIPAVLNAYGASALLAGRNLSVAQRHLEEAVRQRPTFTMAWVNLARVYQRLGRRDASRAALVRARKTLSSPDGQASLERIIEAEWGH